MGFELMNFIYKSKSPSSLKEHGLTICVTVCHFIISRPFVIWTGHTCNKPSLCNSQAAGVSPWGWGLEASV